MFLADEVAFRLREMQSFKKPSKRLFGSLYTIVKPNITGGENKWIHRRDDLVAIGRGAEHGWFDDVLANTLNRLAGKWMLVSKAHAPYQW